MNELQVENPELAGKAERSRAASRAYTLQKGRAKGTWPSARPPGIRDDYSKLPVGLVYPFLTMA